LDDLGYPYDLGNPMSQELKEPLGPGSLGRPSMEAAKNSTNNMGLLETRVCPTIAILVR